MFEVCEGLDAVIASSPNSFYVTFTLKTLEKVRNNLQIIRQSCKKVTNCLVVSWEMCTFASENKKKRDEKSESD
jgi:hypothetical protein